MNEKLTFKKVYDSIIPYNSRKKIKEEYKKNMGTTNKTFISHKNFGYKYSPVEKKAVEEIFKRNGYQNNIWESIK